MEKEVKSEYKKDFIKTIIDILLCISLIVLSIKKGGFYKEDLLIVSLIITLLGFVFLIYNLIKYKGKSLKKVNLISIFLLTLSFAYTLPIFTNNYANLNDSIFELLRYCLLFVVYFIVRNCNDIKLYKYAIICIATLQSIFGIDGMCSRFFENVLKLFGSSYLDKDYDRLSGSIQYANVTAIIIYVAIFFILEIFDKKLSYDNKNKVLKLNFINLLLYINIFALILTKSRVVLIIFVISILIKLLLNKNVSKTGNIILVCDILFSVVFTAMFTTYILSNKIMGYIIFAIGCIFSIALISIIFYFKKKFSFKFDFKKVNKKVILSAILCLFIIYIAISLQITSSLVLSYNSNSSNIVSRNIYDIAKGVNKINITTNNLDESANYDIKVYAINTDRSSELIYTANTLSSSSGNYIFEYYNVDDNFKNLRFDFIVQSGKFEVKSIVINNNTRKINYLLIPSDMIFRIQDIMHGSTSIYDRLEYNKDSFKILSKTYKNFIFGVGGEGFKNLYETVQTLNYYSTEAHNSYLQIFVESGILGFLSILAIIFITIKNYKVYSLYEFLAILGFLIHSLLDLNFSYFLVIVIFGILIAIKDAKKCDDEIKFRLLNDIYIVITTFIISTSFLILLMAQISYYKFCLFENSKYSSEDYDLDNLEKIDEMVKFDFSNISYRKKLNLEYMNYLDYLNTKLNDSSLTKEQKNSIQDVIKDTLIQIKENTDLIYKYDKYNKNTLKYVNDIYSKYIDYFVQILGQDSDTYTQFMKNNLQWIKDNIKLESKYENIIDNTDLEILN